jgi:glycosyltransferase involved in cell wall biosynthesis
MRIKDADAVFITGEEFGMPLALLAQSLGIKRPRFVMRLENLHQGKTHARTVAFEAMLRRALKRIDLVLCRNSVNHQLLLSVYGMHPNRVRVVYDCVDTKFFDPASPVKALPEFTLPKRPFIVSAGLERRDYGVLIEAVRTLDVQLVIAAASPWSHYRFEQGATREVPSNVTVGAFGPMQMRELYRAAAFVVIPLLPTLRTCGDSTLTEAWAMGKGVVVTRTAGLLDFIHPEKNAVGVAPCDAVALRSAIVRLMSDPDLCSTLGRAGREAVNRDHLFEDYVSTIASSLDEVAARGAAWNHS